MCTLLLHLCYINTAKYELAELCVKEEHLRLILCYLSFLKNFSKNFSLHLIKSQERRRMEEGEREGKVSPLFGSQCRDGDIALIYSLHH